MILLLWKEYRKTQEKEVNLCLKAFGVLGISGVIALVLYWVLSIYWYESIGDCFVKYPTTFSFAWNRRFIGECPWKTG